MAFPSWFVGVIGAAGVLTALVPGSMILMTSATILSKNIYRYFSPSVSDDQVMKIARLLVPVVALVAVYFTFNSGSALVLLLLMGYSFVTQIFPAFLFSMLKNNFVTKQAAFAGISAGVLTVTYITVTNSSVGSLFPSLPQAVKDLNVGIIAMIINLVVLLVVSLLTHGIAANQQNEKTAEATK